MSSMIIDNKEKMTMQLIHYFITEENYTPIIVNGVSNEIWLENIEGPVKIVRINSNYIHNKEQFGFDVFKTKKIMDQIKKKTLSIKMSALNIHLNLNDEVEITNDKVIEAVKLNNSLDISTNEKINEIFPNIKDKLLDDTEGMDLIINVTKDINEKTEENNKFYDKIFSEKRLIVTPLLIAISVVMFIITVISGGLSDPYVLLDLGSVYGPFIKNGEVYRLLTGTFLHANLLHIVFNMYALSVIGGQLETYIGKKKFLLVYLVSAIGGSLLSVVWGSGQSVGASGAIFGLLGAITYFGYYNRIYLGSVLKSEIIPVILFNLLIGFMVPGIDNAAHIGGLVAGFLSTMAIGLNEKDPKSNRIHGIITFSLYIIFLIVMVFYI